MSAAELRQAAETLRAVAVAVESPDGDADMGIACVVLALADWLDHEARFLTVFREQSVALNVARLINGGAA